MKRFYLLAFLLFIAFGSSAQFGFQHSFGDTTADRGIAMIKSSTGNYVIVGSTYFHTTDSTEITVYLIYPDGSLNVSSKLGLQGNDFPSSIVEAYDGNFLITGYSYSSPLYPTGADMFVIKVDNVDGFLIWSKFYGGPDDDFPATIIQTPDSNYLIGGSTTSYGTILQAAFAMKIDDGGGVIWATTVEDGDETNFSSATISLDTNYILCGTVLDNNSNFDYFITKLSSNGNIVWSKSYGTSDFEFGRSIYTTADSGFIVAGAIGNNPSVFDMLLTKFDVNSNVVWSKTYSTPQEDQLMGVLQNSSGNYVVAGHSNTDTTGVDIFHLTIGETDPNGNLIWMNAYGYAPEVSKGTSLIHGVDSGYACTGTTYATGDPLGDAYLVKVDTSGFSSCDEFPLAMIENYIIMTSSSPSSSNLFSPDSLDQAVNYSSFSDQYVSMCFWDNIHSVQTTNDFTMYPNPASDQVTIKGDFENSYLSVLNPIGQIVCSEKIGSNFATLNTSAYQPGIYFIHIQNGNKTSVQKLIKE